MENISDLDRSADVSTSFSQNGDGVDNQQTALIQLLEDENISKNKKVNKIKRIIIEEMKAIKEQSQDGTITCGMLPKSIAIIANSYELDDEQKIDIIDWLFVANDLGIEDSYLNIAKYILSQEDLDEFTGRQCIEDIWKIKANDEEKIRELSGLINFINDSKRTQEAGLEEYYLNLIRAIDEDCANDNFDELLEQIDFILADDFNEFEAYCEIALKQDDFFNNPNVKTLMEKMAFCGFDKDEYYPVDCQNQDIFLEDIVLYQLEKDCLENWDEKQNIEKANIEKGLNIIIDGERVDIFNSINFMKFFKSVQNGAISLSDKELIEKYNQLYQNLPEPEFVEKYEEMLKKGEEIPEEEKEQFLEQMWLFRLKNDRFPPIFYRYLIKQVVLNKIDYENNQYVMESAIIDLTEDILEKMGIYDYDVIIRIMKDRDRI